MPECRVRGLKIYYRIAERESEEDTPVIFVHGAGGSSHGWTNQLKASIPGFWQVALDLPGHARSHGQGENRIEEYAKWITAFIQAMGFKECVLAGNSMGGAIVQMVALTRPELLRAVILVGTGARLKVDDELLRRSRQGQSFADYAYAPGTPLKVQLESGKEFELTAPEVRYHDFLACNEFDIMDRIHEIDKPALIICGQEDILTPVKYAQYLHEHLPESRLEIIPEAGHMVMWEQAQQVNRILRDFLMSLS